MISKSLAGLLLAAALALAPSAAGALEESTVPQDLLFLVGDWRLEQEDQSLPTCALTFTEDQVPQGWQVIVPEPCPAPFPAAGALAAWNVDDGAVIVMDAAGNPVLRLVEAQHGLYVTEPDFTPAFYLMLPFDEDGMGGEVPDEF